MQASCTVHSDVQPCDHSLGSTAGVQSMRPSEAVLVMLSHHTPPSGVSAAFAKMEFFSSVCIALR